MASSVVWRPVENWATLYCDCGCGGTIENHPDGIQTTRDDGIRSGVKLDSSQYRLCRATPGRVMVVTDEVIAAIESAMTYAEAHVREYFGDDFTEHEDYAFFATLQAALDAAREITMKAETQPAPQPTMFAPTEVQRAIKSVLLNCMDIDPDNVAVLNHWVYEQEAALVDSAPQPLDMPDAPGWWAFEGIYPLGLCVPVREVHHIETWEPDESELTVNIKWDRWKEQSTVYTVYFRDIMRGKWTRLHMPWDAPQPAPTEMPSVPGDIALILEAALHHWRNKYAVNCADFPGIRNEGFRRADKALAWLQAHSTEGDR